MVVHLEFCTVFCQKNKFNTENQITETSRKYFSNREIKEFYEME